MKRSSGQARARRLEDAAMVGEFITFLHRHVRIVTPAVVLAWAAAMVALIHLFTAR